MLKLCLHLLGPQNATGLPTAPTEIAKNNPNNAHLQTNDLSQVPPFKSPQPISPSLLSGDHTHNIKYLEQLLESSLATVAVIQFSGNTLADVLTPRAYDTFKALYALAALDAVASSTKPRGSEIPNPDTGNDCPYSSNLPLPHLSLAAPCTGRIHISISVDNIMLFLWAGLAVACFLVVFLNFPRLCERDGTGHF